ncbi:MAG: hypothetical protein IPN76_10710 [Saprospiraceae bacterium]|nr:hypothetical protein [Saprospiraceae bacterium]
MMVKQRNLQIAVWLVCLPFFYANAQTEIQQRPSSVRGFSFDFNGDGKWQVDEGVNGKWVDELRLMGTMELSRKLKLVAVDEIRFDQSNATNKITRAFISYGNVFKFNKEKLTAPQSISLKFEGGGY